jgi:hypothetical protein
MIAQVVKTALVSLGIGFLAQMAQDFFQSHYFTEFLRNNLVNLLVALLAVNSATMGIVLTKIRDLIEKYGHGDAFERTKRHMLLSVKEQIVLITASIFVLTLAQSPYLKGVPNGGLFFDSCAAAIFVYGMVVLYDTAKSVLIIVDFKS